jgi:hypothetical protein
MSEQAVIVTFNYGEVDLTPLFALEERLEAAIANAGVGEYDGNEITTDLSNGFLYMYGPDAENLFAVVWPILASAKFMEGASVRMRFGPPVDETPEKLIVLSAS